MYLCFQYPQSKDQNTGTFHSIVLLRRVVLWMCPFEKY